MGPRGHMKKLDFYLQNAITNVEDDRKITRQLLDDIIVYLSADEARHREVGLVAAKYVETLQRSNEQLVKLCGLMAKQETSDELTDKDFAQIFDQIQKTENKDGN